MTPCPQKEGIRLITAFLHGYILALGLILPLGPQNVFVFNQGAAHRDFVRALPVVLAASCSDTLLILAAVMGVSLMVLTFAWVKLALASVGVVFLLLVGWNTWRTRPAAARQAAPVDEWPIRKQVGFAVSVSLLNPHAILDTIGVIGSSSLAYTGTARVAFAAACVLNSWAWFLLLAYLGRLLGTIDATGKLRVWFNRASAVLMWGSAALLLRNLML